MHTVGLEIITLGIDIPTLNAAMKLLETCVGTLNLIY